MTTPAVLVPLQDAFFLQHKRQHDGKINFSLTLNEPLFEAIRPLLLGKDANLFILIGKSPDAAKINGN